MSGVHKYPTISFRISPIERTAIEAKILASGLSKKDYFVRSCLYNKVCVVGTKEQVSRLVDEIRRMEQNLKDIAEQMTAGENGLSEAGLLERKEEFLSLLEAMLWLLEGARYLWQDGKSNDKIE